MSHSPVLPGIRISLPIREMRLLSFFFFFFFFFF
ncbi:hypothetical protein EGK_15662, partial [Macaca mulatta]